MNRSIFLLQLLPCFYYNNYVALSVIFHQISQMILQGQTLKSQFKQFTQSQEKLFDATKIVDMIENNNRKEHKGSS